VGIAVLVKGPLAFVLCGLCLAFASLLSTDARRRLLALNWIRGLLLAMAVALPWFWFMFARFGRSFITGYVLDENVRLFAGSRFGNQPRPWFYFQILAAGLLPWTGLVVGRLVDDVRAAFRREALDTVEVLLWSWTAAIVGFFTASTFKLDHYVFPAAPALCLLCARAWSDVRAARRRRRRMRVLSRRPPGIAKAGPGRAGCDHAGGRDTDGADERAGPRRRTAAAASLDRAVRAVGHVSRDYRVRDPRA